MPAARKNKVAAHQCVGGTRVGAVTLARGTATAATLLSQHMQVPSGTEHSNTVIQSSRDSTEWHRHSQGVIANVV